MVHIGIVGAGGMGTVHYNNYAHIDGCRVDGVVGKTEQDRRRAAEWGLPMYASISEMANAEKIDLVDVCTPTFLHREQVLESLALSKNTITEKPAALSRKDAEEMFAAADRNGVQLYVAQVVQFTKETEVLRRLVRSGEYGPVLDAFFERLSSSPRWAQNSWMFDREKSGLLPFDLHIHDLDLIVSLFGRPDSVSWTSCAGQGRSYPEHFRFLYGFGKLHVCAEAAWYHADVPFSARWRVYFENALVVNDGAHVTAYPFEGTPLVFDTEETVKIPTGINVPPTGWYYTELKHFIHCAELGIPSEFVQRCQVLDVIELLEQISKKAESVS